MDSSRDLSCTAPWPAAALPALLFKGSKAARIVRLHGHVQSPNGRLAALALIGCMATTQAAAQEEAPVVPGGTGNGLPTAEEIWRHLPDRYGQAADPHSEDVSVPDAKPAVPDSSIAVPQPALSRARVVIHHASSEGPERSLELARRLRDAGAGEVEVRPVDFQIGRQSIRYFHDADRAVSQALKEVIRPDHSVTIDDFTHFRPLPSGGMVEVWLP